jgi:hypothetical protein
MILIKQLTTENWKQFKGLPAKILVMDGGTKSWPKGERRIGIVESLGRSGCVRVHWQDGLGTGIFDSVGALVEYYCESISFYYIEIKP